MHPQNYPRLQWFRLAVAVVALCLMLVTALHAPVGALVANGQHTAGSLADHARQPCLDSPSFDWTVPQSGFVLVCQPHRSQDSLSLNPIAYSAGPAEFRLYNRPPPLS